MMAHARSRTTGIRRKVDDLGRIVIPVGIRRTLGIAEGDALEFTIDGDAIMLSRPANRCVLCGTDDGTLQAVHGRHVCRPCALSAAAATGDGRDVAVPEASAPPASAVAAGADVRRWPEDPAALQPAWPAGMPLPAAATGLPGAHGGEAAGSDRATARLVLEERYRLPVEPRSSTAW